MAEVKLIGRDTIAKRLSELEVRYDMPTSDFVVAFKNGKLRETEDFRLWAHLSAAWHLYDRRPARV